MQRTPIPEDDVATFLKEMRRTPGGPLITSKLLAGKIQSTSDVQALKAFEVSISEITFNLKYHSKISLSIFSLQFLETALEAESEGSIEFSNEIGRYRFLNEIIRILSPKYLGEQTAPHVKEKATKFIEEASGPKRRKWFPSEHSKIQTVYQSLIEGGIIQVSLV